MTDQYVLSFDPGVESGVSLVGYREGEAPWLEAAWQFGGGVSGLLEWSRKTWLEEDSPEFGDWVPAGIRVENGVALMEDWEYLPSLGGGRMADEFVFQPANLTVICEKFTARNTKGFSYTTASLEPLRGEGALIALGIMPDYDKKEKRWRDPGYQYLVGGKDLPDKKKRQHRLLEETGFYIDRKVIGSTRPNYDDARSATAHGLKWLATEGKHKPTYDLISDWLERNPV